jgi:hypothetical protein
MRARQGEMSIDTTGKKVATGEERGREQSGDALPKVMNLETNGLKGMTTFY